MAVNLRVLPPATDDNREVNQWRAEISSNLPVFKIFRAEVPANTTKTIGNVELEPNKCYLLEFRVVCYCEANNTSAVWYYMEGIIVKAGTATLLAGTKRSYFGKSTNGSALTFAVTPNGSSVDLDCTTTTNDKGEFIATVRFMSEVSEN